MDCYPYATNELLHAVRWEDVKIDKHVPNVWNFLQHLYILPFFVQYGNYGKKTQKTSHTELSDNYITFYTGIFNQIEESIDKHSLQF